MISMLLSPRTIRDALPSVPLPQKGGHGYATGQGNNLGFTAIGGVELFAAGKGPVAATVADHDQGLATFEFG
jgi:hypothetical protein